MGLADDAGGTFAPLRRVHAQVGGKIAQLGARLIDASAKQMADAFFDRFSAYVAPPVNLWPPRSPRRSREPRRAPPPPSPALSSLALVPREPFGLPLVAWIGGVIYLFILILTSSEA